LTGEPVMRRFFLFWRHGCSANRNSPACKGKSLRCLRKYRFSYIDTSPALFAPRHLTAALRYSARPSQSHLGCQTHQTYCFSTSLEPPPLPPVRYFTAGETPLTLSSLVGNEAAELRFALEDAMDETSALKAVSDRLERQWLKTPEMMPQLEVI
jgi:hypothetical protein